ncbi:FtsK/SpoIIIE domain-containing protein, partial [Streptomyces sp. YIM 98790]|uniref:FtsK/SpoIIIE domain-containing protein n=1 Tax=Streptomyces sp. YIM 98790 TaxID=2689077 RepID=UPI0028BDF4BE
MRELPSFVPGLIGLAQRGRSLGLHLVLATQRPGGSVSTEIKANTNLRISLRVTDRSESQDIIDAPDAVNISPATPGRALVRSGSAAPVPFQSAWAGGERPAPGAPDGGPVAEGAAGGAPPGTVRPVRSVPLTWQGLGRPATFRFPDGPGDSDGPGGPDGPAEAGAPAGGGTAADDDPPTDLRVLVAAVREAAAMLPDCPPQPSPWLPPLEEVLPLDALPAAPPPRPGSLPPVPYGLIDLPEFQDRRLATLDFDSFGHLYVIGAPRSGRTQVLRTLAGSAAREISCADLHIHAIDAAGGGLLPLESLPHCGAVVSRHDTERLERLLTRLSAELTERQRRMAARGCAALGELRAALPPAERPAHLLLLIDGWDALSAMLDDYDGGRLYAEVVRLLREGVAAGVHVVATSERLLLGGRLAAHNDRRLVLRQSDRGDYQLAGMTRGQVPARIPPGRGWHAPSGVEVQIALLPVPAPAGGTAGREGGPGDPPGERGP